MYWVNPAPPGPATTVQLVPENRLRVYGMAAIIETIADTGSTLHLRQQYGVGMHTVLARVGGRPVGILANNPKHLGGAIDGDGALKAARFIELCDAHDLPIVSLVDCPGFMVGTESEADATVRKFSKMFVVGGSITTPFFSIFIRKGYGLGAMAMAGGMCMGHEVVVGLGLVLTNSPGALAPCRHCDITRSSQFPCLYADWGFSFLFGYQELCP